MYKAKIHFSSKARKILWSNSYKSMVGSLGSKFPHLHPSVRGPCLILKNLRISLKLEQLSVLLYQRKNFLNQCFLAPSRESNVKDTGRSKVFHLIPVISPPSIILLASHNSHLVFHK